MPMEVPRREEPWARHKSKRANKRLSYTTTVDFRPELSLIVHYGQRHPASEGERHYKIQFRALKWLTERDLISQVIRVFEIDEADVRDLKVSRVDFTTDVYGVPVQWFRERSHVRYKQSSRQYGSWMEETKRSFTTLTNGKFPDVLIIYNKIAEKKVRGREILSWRQGLLGTATTEPVLTRVERQCSGRAVPRALDSLGKLLDGAADFDPFKNLALRAGKSNPAAESWPPQRWLMNLGLMEAVKALGEPAVWQRLNRNGGNAKRLFKKYSEFLCATTEGIIGEQLRELYRVSTMYQLNRPTERGYPQGGLVMSL